MGLEHYNQLTLKDRLSLKFKYRKWYREKLRIRRRDMKDIPARRKKIDRFEVWLGREISS